MVAGLLLLFLPGKDFAFLVLIAILAMALALRSRELAEALPAAAALLLGVVYVFGSLRCGIDLRGISPYWLFFALSLNWVGDIAALYVGRLIGPAQTGAARESRKIVGRRGGFGDCIGGLWRVVFPAAAADGAAASKAWASRRSPISPDSSAICANRR